MKHFSLIVVAAVVLPICGCPQPPPSNSNPDPASDAPALEGRWCLEGAEQGFVGFFRLDETGDPIRDADGPVGQVTAAAFSPGIGGVAGMALLDVSLAHPGIDAFFVPGPNVERPIRTVSSPLLFNRSLLVDPHRHTYATRDDASDPALWMGSLP